MDRRVGIVLSTYNQEEYLEESILSVLSQTSQNYFLFIIQDDNNLKSTEIIEKYSDHSIVKFYKTEDKGLSVTRNFGLSLCDYHECEFILPLDGDDKIRNDYIEKMLKFADDNPNFSFYYPDTQHFGDSNGYWISKEYNFIELLKNNYIVSCSLIRTSDLLACGGFDENNFNYFEDYENWINMGSKGYYGKHFPEKLFYYRVHKKSGMQSERTRKLTNVYMAYIYSQFPYLYPKELLDKCEKILSQYPKNFMKMKPKEQEKWLLIGD